MSVETAITITIGATVLVGRLRDNPTARDLIAQVPLELEFRDFNSVDKIARPPEALAMNGVPEGDDPDPNDIGYYARPGPIDPVPVDALHGVRMDRPSVHPARIGCSGGGGRGPPMSGSIASHHRVCGLRVLCYRKRTHGPQGVSVACTPSMHQLVAEPP